MSAMAYWNLGWMYEMGKGVPRDWHLAKRNYDLSMETNLEAQLPAMLSLIGLYLRRYVMPLCCLIRRMCSGHTGVDT